MTPINNSGWLNLLVCNVHTDFTPGVSYTYDSGDREIVFSDACTLPAGDDIAKIHINVYDQFGGHAYGHIDAAEGSATVSTSALDPVDGFTITAHVVTDNGLHGTLSVYKVGSTAPVSGSLRYAVKSDA